MFSFVSQTVKFPAGDIYKGHFRLFFCESREVEFLSANVLISKIYRHKICASGDAGGYKKGGGYRIPIVEGKDYLWRRGLHIFWRKSVGKEKRRSEWGDKKCVAAVSVKKATPLCDFAPLNRGGHGHQVGSRNLGSTLSSTSVQQCRWKTTSSPLLIVEIISFREGSSVCLMWGPRYYYEKGRSFRIREEIQCRRKKAMPYLGRVTCLQVAKLRYFIDVS